MLINKNKDVVLNYAEQRASHSTGVDDCVIVYSYVSNQDGQRYYVADGVNPDSSSVPEYAESIAYYGMCSWVSFPTVTE